MTLILGENDQQDQNARWTATLAHWGHVFAFWITGVFWNAPGKQPARDGIKYLTDQVLLCRAETNALVQCLARRGMIDLAEFQATTNNMIQHMDAKLQQRFPGARAGAGGIELRMQEFKQTMEEKGRVYEP